jgi:hypothetical protein
VNPTDFLQRYQQHQTEQANQPTREELFTSSHFYSVIKALETATAAMTSFLRDNSLKVDFPTTMSTPDVDKVVTAVGKLQTSLKPLKQDNTDIVAALHSLEQKMAELPTALSPKEAVEVSNLNELKDQLATLISAVQANNKELPAPKVTVQPTPVTVQPTDTKGIVAALKAVQTEVRNKPVPGTPTIATDPLIAYQPADIDDAGTVQYFGFTQVGGAWYIRKYDTGASPKTLRFAFGQSNYTTAWTNRAAQTYAIWGN